MGLMLVLSWLALHLAMRRHLLSGALYRNALKVTIWLLVLFLLVRRAYCAVNVCAYAIEEMGTECFYWYCSCETAALELTWRRMVRPNLYLPPEHPLHTTAAMLSLLLLSIHDPLVISFWGTDWHVWFLPCLASVMSCIAVYCVCTVTLLNCASSQKCNGFASKTLWRVQVFLSIGSLRLWHFGVS